MLSKASLLLFFEILCVVVSLYLVVWPLKSFNVQQPAEYLPLWGIYSLLTHFIQNLICYKKMWETFYHNVGVVVSLKL